VLETAGRYWAARRITRGVYSISNIYSIEKDWDEAHPKLVEHAIEQGWAESAAGFNFARAYGDYWKEESHDPGAMQIRRNSTLACLRAESGRISPASMMKVNRSHHEGTIVEPRWGAADCFWATPCMHDSPRSRYHTAASLVAHLRADMPPLLRQVYWSSFSNPCCGVFQPFYLHGPRVPANYAVGTSTYSADSPWWQANRVKLLCDLNYRALHPKAREVFDVTEQWEMGRQRVCEAEVIRLLDGGKTDAAFERLQQFINDNCARTEREYGMLNGTLSKVLEARGVEYLYADYLKQWSRQKGVPLPGL
jgi:secernin